MADSLRRRSWLAISWMSFALVLLHQPLSAQTPTQPDQRHTPVDALQLTAPTDAGAYLKYWSTGNTGGAGAQTVFLQNTSTDRTITVTSWEVYDCYNIRGSVCRLHDKKISL